MVCENVQVNGVDFADVPVNEGIKFMVDIVETDGVDEGLLKELEELQQQTEGVLEQVVKYRRAFPGRAADKLSSELSVFLHGDQQPDGDCEMEDVSMENECISENVLSRLSFNVEKTIQLCEQVPKTVAKLERARTVLTEEGQKRLNSANLSSVNNQEWALAVGGAVGEDDLNNVLTRHRRTSHQFDLAHKLSTAAGQFY